MDAVDNFPDWVRVPVFLVGQSLYWVARFLACFMFLWGTLYMSIGLWLVAGLLCYPLMMFEGSPDQSIEMAFYATEVGTTSWNILAGTWNLLADLLQRPAELELVPE